MKKEAYQVPGTRYRVATTVPGTNYKSLFNILLECWEPRNLSACHPRADKIRSKGLFMNSLGALKQRTLMYIVLHHVQVRQHSHIQGGLAAATRGSIPHMVKDLVRPGKGL